MNKLLGGLGLAQSCTIQVSFTRPDGSPAPTVAVRSSRSQKRDDMENLPVYSDKGTVAGQLRVIPTPGKRLEHHGIKVQLVGEVESVTDRHHTHEFVSLARDLAPPGDLLQAQDYSFKFENVEMRHDSYVGLKVRLRYFVRVTVSRNLGGAQHKEVGFWVRNARAVGPGGPGVPTGSLPPLLAGAAEGAAAPPAALSPPKPLGPPIRMEVGIEDCLHIEFEYDSGTVPLDGLITGRIYFLLVRVKIRHMELEIKRRETVGVGVNARSESETVARFEIMDGAPARGEVIPIRLFLEPYDLAPTTDGAVENRFSVKNYLNLVLVDEEERRYFKQQEIILFRGPPAAPRPADALPRGMHVALATQEGHLRAPGLASSATTSAGLSPSSSSAAAAAAPSPSQAAVAPATASPPSRAVAVAPAAASPPSPAAAAASPPPAVAGFPRLPSEEPEASAAPVAADEAPAPLVFGEETAGPPAPAGSGRLPSDVVPAPA